MNFKKLISVVAVAAIATSVFVGCSKKDETKLPATEGKKEIVNLEWVTIGTGMPANYEAWKTNINKYLGEKIGVNIDVEVVSWGDFENRKSVILNSGEAYDIMFVNSNDYVADINLGAYKDISELVKTDAADLYKYIPENYWDAVKVDGKIYSVPTYKDSSMTNYFIWDKAKAEENDIDYENINTFAQLDSALRTLKDSEKTAPLVIDGGGIPAIYAQYDGMSAGLVPLGVRFDDSSHKVVNIFEQEDIMSQLEIMHGWYKDGIMNADAPTAKEVPAYRPFFVSQGWKTAAKTVWGPSMGVEAEAIQFGETIVTNDTVRGSLAAISAGSKNPEKALEFLQLVNLDTKVRDAFYFGLEGDNFEYVDGKVKKLKDDWSMAGYTQGTFFTVSQQVTEEVNQWDEVKKLNESAKASVLLGFTMDTSPVENELANCREIWNKYKAELNTASKEPKAQVEAMTKELKAAGFDTIIETAQKQIDEQFAK